GAEAGAEDAQARRSRARHARAFARQVGHGDGAPEGDHEDEEEERKKPAATDADRRPLPPALRAGGEQESPEGPGEEDADPRRAPEPGEAEEAPHVAPAPAEEVAHAEGAEPLLAIGARQRLPLGGDEHAEDAGLEEAVGDA